MFEEVSSRKRQETKHTGKKKSQENRNNHFLKKGIMQRVEEIVKEKKKTVTDTRNFLRTEIAAPE